MSVALLQAKLRSLLAADAITGRFTRGVLWTLAGTVATNASGLVVAVITAQLLGKEGYGAVGVLVSTYTLFGQFSTLGLGLAATKFVAENRVSNPSLASRIAGTSLVISLLSYSGASLALWSLAPTLARHALAAPGLAAPLRLTSILLLLSGISGVQTSILAGLEAFRGMARILAWRGLLNVILTPLGGRLFGLNGIIWAMIITAAAQCVAMHVHLHATLREHRMSLLFRIDRGDLSALIQLAVPAFLAGILVVPSTWLVNVFLVNQPQGYAEMGVLNAATQWRALAVLVPNVFNSVVLAFQSHLYGAGARKQFDQLALANLKVQTLASAVVAGCICLTAPWIMALYGTGFGGHEAVLIWLAVGWVLLAPSWTLWNIYVSTGQIWLGFTFNLIGTACLLMLALYLRGLGALGIAIAYAVSGVVQITMQGGYFAYWRRSARTESGAIQVSAADA